MNSTMLERGSTANGEHTHFIISVFFVLRFVHETRGRELEQMEGWAR